MAKKKYPECEKLNEVANVHSSLMQFVEYLENNGYMICKYDNPNRSVIASDVVYPFMEVDVKKLEEERREMLAKS